MKYIYTLILSLALFGLAAGPVQAQQKSMGDQIAVPLSKPGEPGTLKVSLIRGSVTVNGYDGKNVVVRYTFDKKHHGGDDTPPPPPGLKRIPMENGGLEVTENDNVVTVNPGIPRGGLELDIMVPRKFSLNISTVNDGNITIHDVSGELEVSNVNGDVTLKDVSGSVVANTVNGDIETTFEKIATDTPMSFTTLNGDINVTLPPDARITAKMRTEHGDIYTNIDMAVTSSDKPKVVTSHDGNVYKVSVGLWKYARINGGGAEVTFKTLNGDITIRKKGK